MPGRTRIPKATAHRLSLYLRELNLLASNTQRTVSSKQLGSAVGITDAQVRKDLAVFGQFGQAGVGYQVAALRERLRQILGTHQQWRAAVVGAGNIGRALLSYNRFLEEGFEIVAVFDQAPALVGTRAGSLTVQPLNRLKDTVARERIGLGIIAVPPDAAQQVADALVAAGVRGILNFAPRRLSVRGHVPVVDVDFTSALQKLAFELSLEQPPAQPVRRPRRKA